MWKYTTIVHSVREDLGLSLSEYCVLDLIYHKSTYPKAPVPGWCSLSKEKIGLFIGISKRRTIDLIHRLIDKGLVEQNLSDNRLLKTTEKWYSVAYTNVAFQLDILEDSSVTDGEQTSPTGNKRHHSRGTNVTNHGEQTSPISGKQRHPYNNNINTNNNHVSNRPNRDEVIAFFKHDMKEPDPIYTATRFMNYWDASDWKMTDNRKVRNWKPLAANWSMQNKDREDRDKKKADHNKPKYKPI